MKNLLIMFLLPTLPYGNVDINTPWTVTKDNPITIALALPYKTYSGDQMKNVRNLTMEVCEPVLQLGIEEVYRQYREKNGQFTAGVNDYGMPQDSIRVRLVGTRLQDDYDSWEVMQLVVRQPINALFGLSYNTNLERISRISGHLGNQDGIPVITTVGEENGFNKKWLYPNLIRMNGHYEQVMPLIASLLEDMNVADKGMGFLLDDWPKGVFEKTGIRSTCFWGAIAIKRGLQLEYNYTTIENDAHHIYPFSTADDAQDMMIDSLKKSSFKGKGKTRCAHLIFACMLF